MPSPNLDALDPTMNLEDLARFLLSLEPDARADAMNANLSGFDATVGLRFVSVALDEVVATLDAEVAHTQPYGLVHGGVYATLAETVASVGAALSVMSEGMNAVGAENTIRFLKPSRPGTTLTVTARPRPPEPGSRRRVWETEVVTDDGGRCAEGTVTVVALPRDRSLAGDTLEIDADDFDAEPG